MREPCRRAACGIEPPDLRGQEAAEQFGFGRVREGGDSRCASLMRFPLRGKVMESGGLPAGVEGGFAMMDGGWASATALSAVRTGPALRRPDRLRGRLLRRSRSDRRPRRRCDRYVFSRAPGFPLSARPRAGSREADKGCGVHVHGPILLAARPAILVAKGRGAGNHRAPATPRWRAKKNEYSCGALPRSAPRTGRPPPQRPPRPSPPRARRPPSGPRPPDRSRGRAAATSARRPGGPALAGGGPGLWRSGGTIRPRRAGRRPPRPPSRAAPRPRRVVPACP